MSKSRTITTYSQLLDEYNLDKGFEQNTEIEHYKKKNNISVIRHIINIFRATSETTTIAMIGSTLTGISAFDIFISYSMAYLLTCIINKVSFKNLPMHRTLKKPLIIGVFVYLFYPTLMNIVFIRKQFIKSVDKSSDIVKNIIKNGIDDIQYCVNGVYHDILTYAPPAEYTKTVMNLVSSLTNNIYNYIYATDVIEKKETFDFQTLNEVEYSKMLSIYVKNVDIDTSIMGQVEYILGSGSDVIIGFLKNPTALVDEKILNSEQLVEQIIPFIEKHTGMTVGDYNKGKVIENIDIFRSRFINTLKKESDTFNNHLKLITKEHQEYIEQQPFHPINTIVNQIIGVPTKRLISHTVSTDELVEYNKYDKLMGEQYDEYNSTTYFNNLDTSIFFFFCILFLFGSLRGMYRAYNSYRSKLDKRMVGGVSEMDNFIEFLLRAKHSVNHKKRASKQRKSTRKSTRKPSRRISNHRYSKRSKRNTRK